MATFFWISGQGLGGIFTGSGTDPNSGPLVVLLALAMVPAVLPDPATWLSPFSTALFRYPVLVLGGVVALVAGLFLSAVYPAAAEESTSTAMAGMTGMSGSTPGSSGESASTATCTRENNGSTRSGLDVTNTPSMSMGGPGAIMNMNGADASAAAGLNTVKANWHYTGPALPTALAQELLAEGANGPTDIHMAATGCASEPTFSQQINATQYVQNTTEAAARYANPSEAVSAGYVPVSPTNYPVVYYVNPTIVAANAAAKRTLDPNSIDGLVYAQTPAGSKRYPPRCTSCRPHWRHRRCLMAPSSSGISAPMCAARQVSDRYTPPDHWCGAVSRRHRAEAHAIRDDGVAGAGGRWTLGHPTA